MFFLMYVALGFVLGGLVMFSFIFKSERLTFSTFFPLFIFSVLLCIPIVNVIAVVAYCSVYLHGKLNGKKQTSLLIDVCALAVVTSILHIFSRKNGK